VHVVAVVDSGAGHVKDDEFNRHWIFCGAGF
jgi:uncharacterized protein YfiM (DUF2279 family)